MAGDVPEHVGEPGFGIDVVELGGGDEGVDCRGSLSAVVGAGEQLILTVECYVV